MGLFGRCEKLIELFDKGINTYYVYLWKVYFFQNLKMFVFCYDEMGIRSNGTVHELIVVRVGCNESELEIRRKEMCIAASDNDFHYIISNVLTPKPADDFGILLHNLIGYT